MNTAGYSRSHLTVPNEVIPINVGTPSTLTVNGPPRKGNVLYFLITKF